MKAASLLGESSKVCLGLFNYSWIRRSHQGFPMGMRNHLPSSLKLQSRCCQPHSPSQLLLFSVTEGTSGKQNRSRY